MIDHPWLLEKGYHQKCHNPAIEDKALEPEEPWMCIFCSSGTECPYLLNPFETKLQKDLNSFSVANSRQDTKNNDHLTNLNSGLIPNKSSRVRNLMANYYHDSYQRRTGIHPNNSHVRHVTGREHHVMNRRGMMEARHKYFRFPDEKTSQRAEQENVDSLSKKRRFGQQKTSRDVWDNGCNQTSREATASDVTNGLVDDVSKLKAAGKDGPREKQRLTQDLEKQRKKLKEDMKRGQELQREHNQLLTRDTTHDSSHDVIHASRDHRLSSEDVPTNDDRRSYEGANLSKKYDRRTYSHNGTEEHSNDVQNSSEKLADSGSDLRSADNSNYTGKQFKINSGSDEHTERLKRKLDPCDCDDAVQGTGLSEDLHEITDMQCEHSSSRDVYHEDSDNAEYTREIHERASSEDTAGNIYSSEKIEVLGESTELNGYDEDNREQRDKSKVKTATLLGRSGNKDSKLNEEKTNYEMSEYQGLRKERQRTKEGSNGRCGSMKLDKGIFKESSSVRKRSSCSDESLDNEHGGSKITRNKSHIMYQDGGNKQHESKYENDITQNRVRSDLPRHNWLVERWINQKNIPTSSEKTRRTSSENFKDSKEATSTLGRTTTTSSPVFEENYKDEVLDEGYTTRNSDDEHINENQCTSSQHETAILEVPFPVKFENDPMVQNNPSPEIKYSPAKQEISPRSLDNSSPEIDKYSPRSRVPPSPKQVPSTTSIVPSSPNKVSATNSSVTTSPKQLPVSPNRIPESPRRIPSSPQLVVVPATTNCIPSPPKKAPSSQNPRPPSSNHTPVSPNEKSIKRPPPIVSQIEEKQISPRLTSKIVQELGCSQDDSRTKRDTITASADNNEHKEQEKFSLRRSSENEEKRIIEVNSDGEESKRENLERNTEVSKIQTGKSVNPVNPIVRTDKHVMDEMHSGIHEARHQGLKAMRVPAEIPPGLPFMGSTYVTGYSPKTFTPHLITHNAPVIPAPASPIMRHPALQGRFPGRLDPPQHGKPDISCPFHGKKAEKMIPHVPGYPIIHGDVQMFPQHALLDGTTEDALKVREKRPEHVEFQSDPLAMQRRLSAAYDRHLLMPHGIPMHHSRYFSPGLIEEQEFTMDSDRYKQRLKAAHAYTSAHKLQSHLPGGVGEEHKSTSRYVVSPSEEKRLALKYMDLPSQAKRNSQKEIAVQSESYRHHHREPSPRSMTSEAQRKDIIKRYNVSPQDMRAARIDHVLRTHPESPVKAGKYSPVAVRHVTTKENHPGFIQLGEDKPKLGTESSSFKPSPSPSTLDRESISRDFNERFNILDKTFKEKLEGTDRSKDETIAAYSSVHRRHELDVRSPTRTWGDNQARGVDPLKYRSLEKHSPHAKHSPPNPDEQRKLQERVSPRGLVTSSAHKPTVPMPTYRYHGGLVPSSPHGGFGRGMVGVPILANHGEYAVWQGMRGPARIPGYPTVSISTKQTQSLPPEKNERVKTDYAMTAKQEYQEKELSLAIEKHRMNLAQLQNERRKAFVKNERMDERRQETAEHERLSPRTREEKLRRKWEQVEYRKRKLEDIPPEVQLSPHPRIPTQIDANRRLIPDKSHHIPDELALRREQYIAMYGRQHDPYGHHAQGVPYPDRARSAGNPPFASSRLDVQRSQAEQSVSEALRKQREYNERQEAIRKMVEQERDLGTSAEPPKKRVKNHRCLCGVCGKDASFLCSGCQKAWYCSAKCQHTAWADHCKECSETKRR